MEVSGEGFGSLLSGEPNVYSGDFVSPEQIIPPEGIFDQKGGRVVWEACATLNNNWGYHATDGNWKPASMVVRKLAECVSKDGNFLLNVGPDARGKIPPESVKILSQVGDWMALNSDSVYNCGYADLPKPDFGRYTRNGKKIYAHVYDNALGLLPLLGLDKGDIVKARMLATGAELSIAGDWTSNNYKNAFVRLGPDPVLPDETDTVVEITVK
jgi:alpha-L-fucosidase